MRLAAKLLFQFRVMVDNSPGQMRVCEERYVTLPCDDPLKAVDSLFEIARKANNSYINDEGNNVYFEFVGVQDYILIGSECAENEFWYNIVVRKTPMENKKKLTMDKRTMKKRITKSIEDK